MPDHCNGTCSHTRVLSQQLQGPGIASGSGLPVIPLVDLGGLKEGMQFPRTTTFHRYNRCKLVGLGCSSSLPCCSRLDRQNDINWLELRAVHLALRHFQSAVAGHHVLVLTDNMTTKAHVNCEGGTQSKPLMDESSRLLTWVERHVISLTAQRISGAINVRADWLSRTQIDHSEWYLHPAVFHELSHRFGHPILDLFPHPNNTQLPHFFSRFSCPDAEGVDALGIPWPSGLLYAFPPLLLILRLIRKILAERADILLVAAHWPQ